MKTRMILKISCLTALVFINSVLFAQDLGIGVRLGDPSGLTIKKYNGDNALEFSIGRTHWINGTGWYNKHYNYWYNNKFNKYDDFQYLSHRTYTPIGMQIHYLMHKDVKSSGSLDMSGLKWYFGFGAFLGTQKFQYDYRYKFNNDPDWTYVSNEVYRNIDLGLDGVLGLEYTFEEVPLSVFLDVSLYMELLDNPFVFGWFSGIGVRYNI